MSSAPSPQPQLQSGSEMIPPEPTSAPQDSTGQPSAADTLQPASPHPPSQPGSEAAPREATQQLNASSTLESTCTAPDSAVPPPPASSPKLPPIIIPERHEAASPGDTSSPLTSDGEARCMSPGPSPASAAKHAEGDQSAATEHQPPGAKEAGGTRPSSNSDGSSVTTRSRSAQSLYATLPRTSTGKLVGYEWSKEDLDILFNIFSAEAKRCPGTFARGTWAAIYDRWLEETGLVGSKAAPSLPAMCSKVTRLRSSEDVRWGSVKGLARRRMSDLSTERAKEKEPEGKSVASSTTGSRSQRPTSTASRPSTASSTLTKLAGQLCTRWSKKEDRLLIKLFRPALDKGHPSLTQAAESVSRRFPKYVDGRIYRARSDTAIRARIYVLSKTKGGKINEAAREIKRQLLQEDAALHGAASQSRQDDQSESEEEEQFHESTSTHATSREGGKSSLGSGSTMRVKRGRDDEPLEVTAEDAGGSSGRAKVKQLEREIDDVRSSLQMMRREAGTDAAKSGPTLTGTQAELGPSAYTSGSGSNPAPSDWKAEATSALCQVRARLTAVERDQQRMRAISSRAWDGIKADRLQLHRHVEEVKTQLEELPAAVASLTKQQHELGDALERLAARMEQLGRRKEERARAKEKLAASIKKAPEEKTQRAPPVAPPQPRITPPSKASTERERDTHPAKRQRQEEERKPTPTGPRPSSFQPGIPVYAHPGYHDGRYPYAPASLRHVQQPHWPWYGSRR